MWELFYWYEVDIQQLGTKFCTLLNNTKCA